MRLRGKHAEDAQLRNVEFVTEQCADIDKRSVGHLAKRRCDFLFLRQREEFLPRLREVAAFDRGQKMVVNRAAHKTSRARDFLDGFAALEPAQCFTLAVI